MPENPRKRSIPTVGISGGDEAACAIFESKKIKHTFFEIGKSLPREILRQEILPKLDPVSAASLLKSQALFYFDSKLWEICFASILKELLYSKLYDFLRIPIEMSRDAYQAQRFDAAKYFFQGVKNFRGASLFLIQQEIKLSALIILNADPEKDGFEIHQYQMAFSVLFHDAEWLKDTLHRLDKNLLDKSTKPLFKKYPWHSPIICLDLNRIAPIRNRTYKNRFFNVYGRFLELMKTADVLQDCRELKFWSTQRKQFKKRYFQFGKYLIPAVHGDFQSVQKAFSNLKTFTPNHFEKHKTRVLALFTWCMTMHKVEYLCDFVCTPKLDAFFLGSSPTLIRTGVSKEQPDLLESSLAYKVEWIERETYWMDFLSSVIRQYIDLRSWCFLRSPALTQWFEKSLLGFLMYLIPKLQAEKDLKDSLSFIMSRRHKVLLSGKHPFRENLDLEKLFEHSKFTLKFFDLLRQSLNHEIVTVFFEIASFSSVQTSCFYALLLFLDSENIESLYEDSSQVESELMFRNLFIFFWKGENIQGQNRSEISTEIKKNLLTQLIPEKDFFQESFLFINLLKYSARTARINAMGILLSFMVPYFEKRIFSFEDFGELSEFSLELDRLATIFPFFCDKECEIRVLEQLQQIQDLITNATKRSFEKLTCLPAKTSELGIFNRSDEKEPVSLESFEQNSRPIYLLRSFDFY